VLTKRSHLLVLPLGFPWGSRLITPGRDDAMPAGVWLQSKHDGNPWHTDSKQHGSVGHLTTALPRNSREIRPPNQWKPHNKAWQPPFHYRGTPETTPSSRWRVPTWAQGPATGSQVITPPGPVSTWFPGTQPTVPG